MEFQSGNLFIRDMGSFEERHSAGWKMFGHEHNFDHNTFIVMGRYRCVQSRPVLNQNGEQQRDKDGQPLLHVVSDVERGPGSILFIDRRCWHTFECLEGPGMLLCLYSHRDPQTGDVVQQFNGWQKAYA